VIERDYMYCYLSYGGYKRASSVMKGFWDRVDANGVDANPYRAGFLQFVGVSETDAQAERDYAAADYFYNRCLHVASGFADAPGYRTMKTVRQVSLDWRKALCNGADAWKVNPTAVSLEGRGGGLGMLRCGRSGVYR
jgi:hypothetical protein